jgi:hypothetical protein
MTHPPSPLAPPPSLLRPLDAFSTRALYDKPIFLILLENTRLKSGSRVFSLTMAEAVFVL